MMRIILLFFAIIICDCSESSALTILRDYDVVHVVNNHNTCSREEAGWWAKDFVKCFTSLQHNKSPNLFNIVSRLLDDSKACITFGDIQCKPNYDGFVHIISKVIQMIKEYTNIHIERLINARVISNEGRNKIKGVDCVENSLTRDAYATCFNAVLSTYEDLLGVNEKYDIFFKNEAEEAISCTNIAHKQCSKFVKIYMNRIVRYILGVKQPEKDELESDRMSPNPLISTEPLKPSSKFRNTGTNNADDTPKSPDFLDSIIQPNFTEFPVLKEKKNRDDLKIISITQTESTTLTNLPTSEKENANNTPDSPGFLDSISQTKSTELKEINNKDSKTMNLTEKPDFPTENNFDDKMKEEMLSSSTELLNFTDVANDAKTNPSEVKNIPTRAIPNRSKSTFSEINDYIVMQMQTSDYEEMLTVSTELPKFTDMAYDAKTNPSKVTDIPTRAIPARSKSTTFSEINDDIEMHTHTSDYEEFPIFPDVTNVKETTPPEVKDFPTNTITDSSKSISFSEINDDIVMHTHTTHMHASDYEGMLTVSTELPNFTDMANDAKTSTSKVKDFPTNIIPNLSKNTAFSEINDDIEIHMHTSEYEEMFADSTEFPNFTDVINIEETTPPEEKDFSTNTIPDRIDPPKITRPTELPDSTMILKITELIKEDTEISKNISNTEMREDIVIDILDSQEKLPVPTKLSISTDEPKSIAMTSLPKPRDISSTAGSTKLPERTNIRKVTASTKRPTSTDLPKITRPTSPRRISTSHPKTTTIRKPPETTHRPTTKKDFHFS